MIKSGIIFLTSTGLSSSVVFDKFKEIVSLKKINKAVIVTTAAEGKDNNQYSQLALSQLKAAGLSKVDFYDLEKDGHKPLSEYNIIYVCGGNTFKLMKFAKTTGFDKEIKALLKRGGVYIGVSAGSIVLGPSIKIADEINPDKNEVELTDLTGFNIVDFSVFPHYSNDFEEDIKKFEIKNNLKVERIDNSHAILIQDNNKFIL